MSRALIRFIFVSCTNSSDDKPFLRKLLKFTLIFLYAEFHSKPVRTEWSWPDTDYITNNEHVILLHFVVDSWRWSILTDIDLLITSSFYAFYSENVQIMTRC